MDSPLNVLIMVYTGAKKDFMLEFARDIEYIDLSNAILPTKRTYAYIHAPLRRA